MKKSISFLLITAMLIGCLAPALVTTALSGYISVDYVEVMEGTDTNVSLAVNVESNPGISYVKLAVVYDSAKLAKGDDSDAFANTIFSADMGYTGSKRASTHKDIRNYIPEGLENAKGFIVEVETEDGSNVYDDGIIAEIPLELVDPAVGDVYTVYVSVVDAYDEYGDEVIESGTMVTGSVSYVADPYIGIYDEFTVFTSPSIIEIEDGASTVSVDVRFDSNPGLWASRMIVVYPDELSLADAGAIKNGNIYEDSALVVGNADVPLTANHPISSYAKMIRYGEIPEGEGYTSTVLYFEPSTFDAVISGNGVLASLNFVIDGDAKAGEVYDVKIYYSADEDFLYAGTDSSGMPLFITYNPNTFNTQIVVAGEGFCAHTNTYVDYLEPSCGVDGYERVICESCGEIVEEFFYPAACQLEYSPAVEATCMDYGYAEYWYCPECEAVYADADGFILTNRKNLVILPVDHYFVGGACIWCDYVADDVPTNEHNLAYVPATEACHVPGCAEYWYCVDCEAVFSDPDARYLTNRKNLEIEPDCDLIYVGYVAPTCFADGCNEYWYCPECEAVYQDSTAIYLTNRKNLIIPTTEHSYVNGVCIYCGDGSATEDGFTVIVEPETDAISKYASGVDVDIVFQNNPGLWSTRMLIVYPDSLSVTSVDNSCEIYTNNGDLVTGIPDLPVSVNHPIKVYANMVANGEITHVYGYNSIVIYFEPSYFDTCIDTDGVLATLHFEVVGELYEGDMLNITAYYDDKSDFLYAGTDASGDVEFITYCPDVVSGNICVEEGECYHEEIYTETVNPNCGMDGYYMEMCDTCGMMLNYITYPATGDHIEGDVYIENATCTSDGIEIVSCEICGQHISVKTIPASGHNFLNPGNVTIRNATCTEDGYKTIRCDNCDEITTEIIPAYGHDEDVVVEVPGSCMEPGKLVYYCSFCGELQREEYSDSIIGDHVITYYEAIEATCHQNGRQEFWMCEVCQGVWSDENLRYMANVRMLTIPYTAEIIYVEAVEAACHQEGNVEYWYCADCDAVFTDAALTQLSNRKNVIIPAYCEVLYSGAKSATCATAGSYEYWYCPECDAVFADAALTQLTNRKNLTIPATGEHKYSGGVCKVCGAQEDVVFDGAYEISDTVAFAGDTIDVYVYLPTNPGIISLRSSITYDTSALQLISVEDLGLLNGFTQPSPDINSPYIIRWADGLALSNNTNTGAFVKLTFAVAEGANVGDYVITVDHIEARTIDGEKVYFESASATVTVIDYVLGDLDNDGEINDWDDILLQRYLAGWKVEIVEKAADIDGDGMISDWDEVLLQRYLAGWNVAEFN